MSLGAAASVTRGVAAVAVALLAACAPADAEDLKKEAKSGLHYLEIVTGGAAADSPLPVVIAIHGLGDKPESFRLLLDDLKAPARVIVPRAPMPHGDDGFAWFAFHGDDGGEGERELEAGIREAAERIAQMAAQLTEQHGGPSRVVVCGFSQGGILSFAVASAHPELVAAAVPVAGYLPPALWPAERPKIRPLPKVVALHGETDRLISPESARWTVEALRSNGYDTSLRTWPGVGHALVPDIRATLTASVVAAVQTLGPPQPANEAPPTAAALPRLRRPLPADGIDASPVPAGEEVPPQLDEPSPLDE